MKLSTKGFVISYVLTVTLVMAIIIICADKCADKELSNSIDHIEAIKKAPIRYSKDDAGLTHADKEVAQADAAVINALYNHLLDSVIQHLNVKKKDIQSVTAIGTEASGEGKMQIVYVPVDTCVNTYPDSILYKDDYLEFEGSTLSDSARYRIRDSIVLTTYWKKNKLFVDGFSMNKNAAIKGITAVDLQQAKPHKFGLDIMVGYSWNGKSFGPSIGVGLAYRITK